MTTITIVAPIACSSEAGQWRWLGLRRREEKAKQDNGLYQPLDGSHASDFSRDLAARHLILVNARVGSQAF